MTDGVDELALQRRAAMHAALGDPTRLALAERLLLDDLSAQQAAEDLGISKSLLSHHLKVLTASGVVTRHRSEGDGRRHYLRLGEAAVRLLRPRPLRVEVHRVLFVCTANSARSQLAEALWRSVSTIPAESAGVTPADRVHPRARQVARRLGLALSPTGPRTYQAVTTPPDLLVTVCDRAGESALPFTSPRLHWSVPDPVPTGRSAAFDHAARELGQRVHRLATALA